MEGLTVFQHLKKDVLLKYKEHHPYFDGNWKTFSSQDIQNLIDLISENVKQTISEKWIYTHLKPEINDKLPRKDMLDILSKFVGFSGWDEYSFKQKGNDIQATSKSFLIFKKRQKIIFVTGIVLIMVLCYYLFYKNELITVAIEDKYTNEAINNEVEAVIIEDSSEVPIKVVNSKISIPIKDSTKIKLKSPFYKEKTIIISSAENQKVHLESNDYAMILKGFMKADIKDWQTRKRQMQSILDEDLEVLVMLRNNLGTEYFNKEEFIELVIIPTPSLKKMEIVELKSNLENDKINFIRILQE